MTEPKLPSTITVKNIPTDVYRLIISRQSEIKTKKGTGQYSLSQTIVEIVREYKKMKDSCSLGC